MPGIVKQILKKIFPTPFLKDVFLIYNKIKIKTIDRILFPEFIVPKNEFRLYRIAFPFRENQISTDDLHDDHVRKFMQAWNDWTQEEFILEFKKPCWIEPTYGWAIIPPNNLLYYSIAISRTVFQRKPDIFKFINRKRTIALDKAISLRDSGEQNYFHFYNDILAKIFFLRLNNIDVQQYAFILAKKLWDKPYFQFYLKNSEMMKSLRWTIQDDNTFFKCNEVIFCKPLTHRKDLLVLITNEFPAIKPPVTRRKIFLTRDKKRLRFIENFREIEDICIRNGFEIVDTDHLSIEKQISLFSEVEFVIAIHGAGLTNLLFRRDHCKVIELFPPPDLGYLPYHYIMLAKMQGFSYEALIGSAGKIPYSGGFFVDPGKFEETVLQWN